MKSIKASKNITLWLHVPSSTKEHLSEKKNNSIFPPKPWESNFQCKWDLNILLLPGKSLTWKANEAKKTDIITHQK